MKCLCLCSGCTGHLKTVNICTCWWKPVWEESCGRYWETSTFITVYQSLFKEHWFPGVSCSDVFELNLWVSWLDTRRTLTSPLESFLLLIIIIFRYLLAGLENNDQLDNWKSKKDVQFNESDTLNQTNLCAPSVSHFFLTLCVSGVRLKIRLPGSTRPVWLKPSPTCMPKASYTETWSLKTSYWTAGDTPSW